MKLVLPAIDSEPPVTPETSRTRLRGRRRPDRRGQPHSLLTRQRGPFTLTPPASCPPVTVLTSAARAIGLQVLRLGFMRHHLDGARDTTGLAARACEAEVFANAGRRTLGFSLEWTDTGRREVWLSVPQLPW